MTQVWRRFEGEQILYQPPYKMHPSFEVISIQKERIGSDERNSNGVTRWSDAAFCHFLAHNQYISLAFRG